MTQGTRTGAIGVIEELASLTYTKYVYTYVYVHVFIIVHNVVINDLDNLRYVKRVTRFTILCHRHMFCTASNYDPGVYHMWEKFGLGKIGKFGESMLFTNVLLASYFLL